jgi:hypothetical protein
MNSRRPRGRREAVREVPVTDQLAIIRQKFTRLQEVRAQLDQARNLYREHDAVMEELLPMFIQQTPTGWIINREITIGTQTYRFNPYFYDTRRNKVVAKVWKSTAFETGSIE